MALERRRDDTLSLAWPGVSHVLYNTKAQTVDWEREAGRGLR